MKFNGRTWTFGPSFYPLLFTLSLLYSHLMKGSELPSFWLTERQRKEIHTLSIVFCIICEQALYPSNFSLSNRFWRTLNINKTRVCAFTVPKYFKLMVVFVTTDSNFSLPLIQNKWCIKWTDFMCCRTWAFLGKGKKLEKYFWLHFIVRS